MCANKWFKFGFLITLLLPTQFHLVAGQSATISGYLEDVTSRERILGANIYVPSLEIGTTTNQFGFFSLTLPPDSVLLLITHVGYESAWYHLELRNDTTLTLSLSPRVVWMQDVEVIATIENELYDVQMSHHEITIEEIETLPVILGEIDIQKTLQLLPSVQSGIEGSSGLYVRGGRADQNLILLDGLPLYNPNHIFGFFSVFNASAMKQVQLIKGGFPARYGGRLSSVLNYTMKEGNLNEYQGEGSIGVISSRLMFEGPIIRERSSFLIAGRRTYIDQLARPFQRSLTRYGADFYDLNLKVNYILSNNDRIYLSAYTGGDNFGYDKRYVPPETGVNDRLIFDLGWGNRLISLRWNRLLGDQLFANTLVGAMRYKFSSRTYSIEDLDNITTIYEGLWHSKIIDWTAKIDLEYIPNPTHYIRFGAEGILHHFTPTTTQRILEETERDAVSILETPSGDINSWQIAFYLEDVMQLHSVIKVSAGLRFSRYAGQNSRFQSIEPRLGINIRVGETSVVKASYARSKQYVHLLSGGGTTFPTDLWIPAKDGITPQTGYQLALGFLKTFRQGHYQLSVESYFKRMEGHLEYRTGADQYRSAFLDWPELIEIGKGASHGAEIFIQKKTGYLTGWIGYTLSRSDRQFESLNQGHSYPDGYDRRHDISAAMQYQLSDSRQLSAVWVYGSGYPVWVPIGRYISGFQNLLDTGPINSARAPDYHRLDLSIHFKRDISWGKRTLSVGVYNAYNRKNPMFIYPTEDPSAKFLISYRQLSFLQLIPAISWQLKF